tara:strand:- start:1155 stop:2258 length:1104 start_codon:yes stop_codon:yes gene_type:complete
MKNLLILFISLMFTSCASTCMEYRSATTAARTEKNLKRAEEWALKALSSPECDPENDAKSPYFLATEVYLKQKKYIKMAEMLDIAEARNSDQLLETPFRLGDIPVTTIGQGINAFRDQEWAKIYNNVVDLVNREKIDKAKEKIEIAILIHPQKSENYSTLAAIYLKDENLNEALSTVNRGLEVNNNSSGLNQLKADIIISNKPSTEEMEEASTLYNKAIEFSQDPGPIMKKLVFVYIDMGDNERAIDYSNELLDKFPNDADIYYNIGVLYQRLTVEKFDPARALFLKTTDTSPANDIKEVYNSFVTARKYAYNSKDYFLQAGDLELDENLSTRDAVSEMTKLMDQIDDLFMPSIRETARSAKVDLEN